MRTNIEIKTYLEQEKKRLAELLERTHKHLFRDEPVSADFSEQAVEIENDQVVETLDHEATLELAEIKRALQRIDADTYGLCEACEHTIQIERLQAIPYTALCFKCASQLEQERSQSAITSS